MYLSGTGITTPVLMKVVSYDIDTRLALSWTKTTSGNYVVSDRGATNDLYQTTIKLVGIEGYINSIIAAIEANRQAASHELTLSVFNGEDDFIFGADVDYSAGLTVTVTKIGERKQTGWRAWSLSLDMTVLSPSFTGTATMPTLQYISRGYIGDTSWTADKQRLYEVDYAYVDRGADTGVWTGEVTLSVASMRNLRRYIATQRGATISLAGLAGVTYPYGPTRTSTFPLSCRILEMEDLGMWGKQYCRAKLTIVEQVTET